MIFHGVIFHPQGIRRSPWGLVCPIGLVFPGPFLRLERRARREALSPSVQKPPCDQGLKLAVFSGVWACDNGMSENYSLWP